MKTMNTFANVLRPRLKKWYEKTVRMGQQGKAVGCVPPTALLFEPAAQTRS